MISWYIESVLIALRSSLEVTLHVFEAFHQAVDVVGGAVDVHGRAGGGGNAVAQAGRAGAVVADAHGYAALVEQLPDVVRVDALQGERDRTTTVLGCCGPDDAQSIDLLQRL